MFPKLAFFSFAPCFSLLLLISSLPEKSTANPPLAYSIRFDVNGTSVSLPQYSLLYVSRAIEGQRSSDLVPLEERLVDTISKASRMIQTEHKLFYNLLAPGLCDPLTRELTREYVISLSSLADMRTLYLNTSAKYLVPITVDETELTLPSYGYLYLYGFLRNTFKHNSTDSTGPLMLSAYRRLGNFKLMDIEKIFFNRLSTASCDPVTHRYINEYMNSVLIFVRSIDFLLQSIDFMSESLTDSLAALASMGLPINSSLNVAPILQAITSFTHKLGR